MSYDLYVIGVRSGENPLDAWERLGAAQETDAPELEPFELDHAEIAASFGITEDEARARYRHVELNTPEGDLPSRSRWRTTTSPPPFRTGTTTRGRRRRTGGCWMLLRSSPTAPAGSCSTLS